MSLRVWLPLDGDLNNQGISNIKTISSTNSSTVNNGKIGSCIKVVSTTDLQYIPNFNTSELSFGGWFKFNQSELASVINAASYTNVANTPTGNILGNTSYGGIGIVWTGNNHYSSGTFSSMNIFATLRTSTVNNSTASFLVTFDTWIHIMLTWNPNTHILSLYKNGILVGNKTFNNFSDGISRQLYLNYKSIYGGNGPSLNIPMYCNDIRIYDHCLSAAEVHEISQGLVLHYKLDGFQGGYGNKNLLAKYVVPGQAGPASVANGGRTTWLGDYKITIPATENADTYFRLFMTEQLTSGTTYTISCKVSGLLSGSYYRFPLFSQSNTSMGVLNLDHNGLCSLTFTMNWTGTQTAATGANGETVYVNFLDDAGRAIVSGQGAITLYDFKLEKGSSATAWCPSDVSLTQIQDSSGYNHNATLTNGLITNDTARFLHSLTLNTSTKAIGETIFEAGVFIPEYTWAGWIKRNYTTTSSKQIHANIANINLYSDFTPYLSWTSGKVDGSTTGNGAAGGTKIATLNEWVHMAITYKSGIGKFYIDGELIKTWDYTSQGVYIVTAANNTLGNSFIGNLSDVRIYTTALSADDILQLYHTSAKIDNTQKLHTFELVENHSKISINKKGQVLCKELTENTDTKFYKTNQAIDTEQIIEF